MFRDGDLIMLQMRWVEPSAEDEDTPKALVKGWNGHVDYYVLQFRDVSKVNEYGEVVTATKWETVKEET
jgi:hypothetical protein